MGSQKDQVSVSMWYTYLHHELANDWYCHVAAATTTVVNIIAKSFIPKLIATAMLSNLGSNHCTPCAPVGELDGKGLGLLARSLSEIELKNLNNRNLGIDPVIAFVLEVDTNTTCWWINLLWPLQASLSAKMLVDLARRWPWCPSKRVPLTDTFPLTAPPGLANQGLGKCVDGGSQNSEMAMILKIQRWQQYSNLELVFCYTIWGKHMTKMWVSPACSQPVRINYLIDPK